MKPGIVVLGLLLAVRLSGQEPKPAKPEIERIYDEDQKDRDGDDKFDLDSVKRFIARDETRRKRVRELLAAGTLKSGKDFEKAAFIFQHGQEPDDFLFAHILAMVAMSKGNEHAVQIAAATLDRYLQKIGRPQVLGTQSGWKDSPPLTQEPYNRDLVSDALREELHVPSQAKQAKDLAEANKNQQTSPK
jgi:hypothetical protein